MSKGLEALGRITEHLDLEDLYFYKQEKFDEEIVEKELKALEIIKENFDIIAMIKKASAQGLCNLQDKEYKLLEEILK